VGRIGTVLRLQAHRGAALKDLAAVARQAAIEEVARIELQRRLIRQQLEAAVAALLTQDAVSRSEYIGRSLQASEASAMAVHNANGSFSGM